MSISTRYAWLEATTGMRLPTAQTHTPSSATPQSGPVYRVNTTPPSAPINRGSPLPTGRLQPSFAADPFVTYQPGYEPSYSRLTPQSATNPTITPNRPAVASARPSVAPYANSQPVVNNAYTPGANYRPSGSGIAAKNAAAARGATGAQAAAAARAAAPTVVSPAMAARGTLGAVPLIGAGLSGAVMAGYAKANGADWWETAGVGVGAAVGTMLGQAGGAAAGAVATVNPVGAAVGGVAGGAAGSIAGASIGGAVGRATGSVLGRIPGVGGAFAGTAAGILPGGGILAAGADLVRDFLQSDDVAGPAIATPEDGLDTPPLDALNWPANLGFGIHYTSGQPAKICGKLLNPGIFFNGSYNQRFAMGIALYKASPSSLEQSIQVFTNNSYWGSAPVLIGSQSNGFPGPTCSSPDYSQPAQPAAPANRPTDRPTRDPYNPLEELARPASPATVP
ncbi:hypothetical protein IQ254_25085, partial [Nodosilinea sp. LEGE 07088]|nr:hypothetical protein [Nodosilinea sp. LEGE 07088]